MANPVCSINVCVTINDSTMVYPIRPVKLDALEFFGDLTNRVPEIFELMFSRPGQKSFDDPNVQFLYDVYRSCWANDKDNAFDVASRVLFSFFVFTAMGRETMSQTLKEYATRNIDFMSLIMSDASDAAGNKIELFIRHFDCTHKILLTSNNDPDVIRILALYVIDSLTRNFVIPKTVFSKLAKDGSFNELNDVEYKTLTATTQCISYPWHNNKYASFVDLAIEIIEMLFLFGGVSGDSKFIDDFFDRFGKVEAILKTVEATKSSQK